MESFTIDDCLILHETERAILVESDNIENEDGQLWVPKSQVHDDSEIWTKGENGRLTVNMWFAEQNGLV